MKKNLFLLLLILLLQSISSCKSEKKKIQEQNLIIENTIKAFEAELLKQQIDSIFSKYNFNAAVAVYRDSLLIYRKENGFRDFKNQLKIDSNTIFAIASNSKQFTATLILRLQEQGKLKVTDKVSDYLDKYKTTAYQDITIQQLLNHTSGMQYFGQSLRFEPGTDFKYSNDGYNSLGEIIEKVSGKSFSDNAKALFELAGLKNTFTGDNFQGNNFASAYLGTVKNAHEIPNMPARLSGNGIGIPAGGMLSTLDDFHLWNRKLFGGEIISKASLEKMTRQTASRMKHFTGSSGYGDGLMMYGEGPLAYFHTGYVKGAPSLTIFYPETKTAVMIFSNLADESKAKKVIFQPHLEIKSAVDAIQNTVIQLREELLIEVE